MSLYNMLFGQNPNTAVLLAMIGLAPNEVPRLRDTFVVERDGKPVIAVYTRVGGGNREHWDYTYPNDAPGPDCPCPACRARHVLGKHELYLHDEDDDYDSTYATYFFKVPDKLVEFLGSMQGENVTPSDKFKALIEQLESGEETDETKRALDVGKEIFKKIEEKPGGGIIEV